MTTRWIGKCDLCDAPATQHGVEVVGGEKLLRSRCEEHGVPLSKPTQPPLQWEDVIKRFVSQQPAHAAWPVKLTAHLLPEYSSASRRCDDCGLPARLHVLRINADASVASDAWYCGVHAAVHEENAHPAAAKPAGWPPHCDKCNQPATHHVVEKLGGIRTAIHLCDAHAEAAGLGIKIIKAG